MDSGTDYLIAAVLDSNEPIQSRIGRPREALMQKPTKPTTLKKKVKEIVMNAKATCAEIIMRSRQTSKNHKNQE